MTERLTYAYAVLPADAPEPHDVRGLDDSPVRLVRGSALAVAVSDVDPALADVDAGTADPEQLARWATVHFDTVGRLFGLGAVLPLRLGTMYTSPDSALAAVEARAEPLVSALGRTTGAAQWSVRLDLRPSGADEDEDRPASGAEYLARLQSRRQRSSDAQARRRADARQALTAAAALATSVDGPVDSPDSISAAFLVPVQRAEEFHRTLQGLGQAGGELSVLGPLPPYSFVPGLEPGGPPPPEPAP